MYYRANENTFCSMLERAPVAAAVIRGSEDGDEINGTVKFYELTGGVLVVADILGVPVSEEESKTGIFAFHIHNGTECSGNSEDPFANSGAHYDTKDRTHPYHAGDMPPLFSAGGRAFLAFLTDRFTVNEIIGKAVIIHAGPDDFTTQPSGSSGKKIACGIISKL